MTNLISRPFKDNSQVCYINSFLYNHVFEELNFTDGKCLKEGGKDGYVRNGQVVCAKYFDFFSPHRGGRL